MTEGYGSGRTQLDSSRLLEKSKINSSRFNLSISRSFGTFFRISADAWDLRLGITMPDLET